LDLSLINKVTPIGAMTY